MQNNTTDHMGVRINELAYKSCFIWTFLGISYSAHTPHVERVCLCGCVCVAQICVSDQRKGERMCKMKKNPKLKKEGRRAMIYICLSVVCGGGGVSFIWLNGSSLSHLDASSLQLMTHNQPIGHLFRLLLQTSPLLFSLISFETETEFV